MPSEPVYTDTVTRLLIDRLGPDAFSILTEARRHPAVDPIRAELAAYLHTAALHTSHIERDLRAKMRTLHGFLGAAQLDLRRIRTLSHWEVIGISGTAADQAAAQYGQALEHLDAAALLYTHVAEHLPAPAPASHLSPALLDACRAETDQSAHPAWARAAAETYAAFTLYRPDQRNLDDPEAVEMIAGDLVSDLLHLADTAAVPGSRHDLLDDAYLSYLATNDEQDRDSAVSPAAPADPRPDDASRTSAHP